MWTIITFAIVLQCSYGQINPINDECKDRIPCTFMKNQCQNQFMQSTVRNMCKKTCGLCNETDCRDYNINCEVYKQNNMCNSHFINNSCRKSCGLCQDNGHHTTPSSHEDKYTDKPVTDELIDGTTNDVVTDRSLEDDSTNQPDFDDNNNKDPDA